MPFLEIRVLKDILLARWSPAVSTTMDIRNRVIDYLFACAITFFSITLYAVHQDIFPDTNPAWGCFFGLSLIFSRLISIEPRQ